MTKKVTHATIRFAFIASFFIVLAGIILYARGYRLDVDKKTVSPTGIIAVSSFPKAAQIFINNQLKGVTDSNVILPPGNYTVVVRKEGYNDWVKQVRLQGELVISLDASLFPKNPSLSPLTNLGIKKVFPIDQTDRMLLFVDNSDELKDGIYSIDTGKKAFSFFGSYRLLVKKSQLPSGVDFDNGVVTFSPDSKQALLEFPLKKNSVAYIIAIDDENPPLLDASISQATLKVAWETEEKKKLMKILETYPKEIKKIASDSFHIISFSPDDTKLLYQSNVNVTLPLAISPPLIAANPTEQIRILIKGQLYLYDKKEDKNYALLAIPMPLGKTDNVTQQTFNIDWYPDSKHIIFADGKKLQVLDYDGENLQTFYSGPFENGFFHAGTDEKIIILANLNPAENKSPDLYGLGIR